MTYSYLINISADAGEVLPCVGDMLKRVNAHIANYGCDEKLGVRGKIFAMTLTSKRQLNKKDKRVVKTILENTFAEHQPSWKVRVESFRRQSGNVQRSAA